MNYISQIENKLERHNNLKISKGQDYISAIPNSVSGFEVGFYDENYEFTVSYGGWHHHFEKTNFDDALDCFEYGLFGDCRIKVVSRGKDDVVWTLEIKENGNWVESSTTGLIFTKFWKKKNERYMYNRVST